MSAPRLPRFVVLGQGKSGTSLIYRVLAENRLIGLSDPKELHYFSANFDKGPDWYAGHFAHIPADTALVGEVSPSYLATEPLTRIAETLGRDIKVIFVLRRPIERIYSRYLQDICATQQGGGFHILARAMPLWLETQLAAIRTCYDLFGAANVLPLFFETDIIGPDPQFEARILAHLGLPAAHHAVPFLAEPVNAGVMPRYLCTGDKPLITFIRGKRYVIPKHRLLFCAQQRNSDEIKHPSPDQVAQAFYRQCSWSSFVSQEEYADLQTRAVLPLADRLEAEFGFDMSHWRNPPQRLIYDPGLPLPRFQKDLRDDG